MEICDSPFYSTIVFDALTRNFKALTKQTKGNLFFFFFATKTVDSDLFLIKKK